MTQQLRAVIVDDEPLALRRLEIALDQIPDLEVAGRARDGTEAREVIAAARPDVVFLDIKMPGDSGLDLAASLGSPDAPAVIFVTAFGRHAVEAFDLCAVDYLLKPFEFERLQSAVDRARAALEARQASARVVELKAVISALRDDAEPSEPAEPRYETELWINEPGARMRVPVASIGWFEAERDYVRIHTAERDYLARTSIRGLAERLDPEQFTRVHRSFLVRLSEITHIVRRGAGATALVTRSGREIPIGRRFQAALREKLNS